MSDRGSLTDRHLEHLGRADLAVGFSIALLCVFLLWLYIPPSLSCPVDFYRQMAAAPFRLQPFPYGRRLLTPFLVFLLSSDIDAGFRLLTTFALFLCGGTLFLLMRSWGLSVRFSGLGTMLFYGSATVKFCFANFWFVDPISFLAYSLVFLGLRQRLMALVSAALLLGTVNREQTLFLIPVIAVAVGGRGLGMRGWLQFLLVVGPAAIAACLIEFAWPYAASIGLGLGHSHTILFQVEEVRQIFRDRGFSIFADVLFLRWLFGQLLPWGVLGLIHVGRRDLAVAGTHLFCVVFPLLFAVDIHRLLFYAFPIVLPLVCQGLHLWEERFGFLRYWMSALVAVVYILWPLALWPLVFALPAAAAFFLPTSRAGDMR